MLLGLVGLLKLRFSFDNPAHQWDHRAAGFRIWNCRTEMCYLNRFMNDEGRERVVRIGGDCGHTTSHRLCIPTLYEPRTRIPISCLGGFVWGIVVVVEGGEDEIECKSRVDFRGEGKYSLIKTAVPLEEWMRGI